MTQQEKNILRELAQKQLDYARSDKNQERIRVWKEHGAEKLSRPLVSIEIDSFEGEVLEGRMRCTSPDARRMERRLLRSFLNAELFDDDWVVPDYYGIALDSRMILFGRELERVKSAEADSIAYQYKHPITDLGQDIALVRQPSVHHEYLKECEAYQALAQDTFGDILPVRRHMNALYAPFSQQVVHWMGTENMFYAMYDYPDEFHEMMNRIADDLIAYFDDLEKAGLLLPTTGCTRLWQGSLCFTDALPASGPIAVKDCWGSMDAQESVGLSPKMYGEFIFPYYMRVAARFGGLSYGCCEGVDPVWEYVRQLPNLRKVSISPWCNEEFMGEQLKRTGITYLRKPSPNYLGMGTTLDEDALKAHFERTARAAQGCLLEVAQRDVYTVNHDMSRPRRYIELLRATLDKYYRP